MTEVQWPPPPSRATRLARLGVLCALVAGSVALVVQPPDTVAAPEGPTYEAVLIEGVPHVRQKPDYCGEACASSALQHLGHEIDQDAVFAKTGVDPALGRGAWTRELKVGLSNLGFDVGDVWHEVRVSDLDAEMEAEWAALHEDLKAGIPSIICTRYDDQPKTTEHFRLIPGYDPTTDEVVYHEPAEDDGSYRHMDRSLFLDIWPLKYDADRWTVIRFRLAAGPDLEPDPVSLRARELRATLSEEFTVVEQPPWVVVGDEDEAVVQRRARRTVDWSTTLLKQQYFSKNPDDVWTIWLFADRASYRRNALAMFGDVPDTPYGYATGTHHALVMNIATGGGTLVHEIVHPLMDANVTDCPPWLNEGLASLYEACSERDGKIVGLLNWRLEGLQAALQVGPIPTFEQLFAMNSHAFYERDPGTNYAQARYLLYYLQDKGLLDEYWRQFAAQRADDPTGLAALKTTLGADDLERFQADWEAWIAGLQTPR